MFSLTLPQINFILLSKCRLLLPTLQHSQRCRFGCRPGFRGGTFICFLNIGPFITKICVGVYWSSAFGLVTHQFFYCNTKIVCKLSQSAVSGDSAILPSCTGFRIQSNVPRHFRFGLSNFLAQGVKVFVEQKYRLHFCAFLQNTPHNSNFVLILEFIGVMIHLSQAGGFLPLLGASRNQTGLLLAVECL